MVNGEAVRCPGCNGPMVVLVNKLDVGWAGDGPSERHEEFGGARDVEFAGILADVYTCSGCGRVAIRPVRLALTRSRVHAA